MGEKEIFNAAICVIGIAILFIHSFIFLSFFAIFLLQLPLDLVALFSRNVSWVKIPHGE